MHSNLPPGCSVNDLPGNSIKDVFTEKWMDERWATADSIEEYGEDCNCPIKTSALSVLSLKELAEALGKDYCSWLEDGADEAWASERG